MALNPLVDSRDVRFVLFEMLEIEKLTKLSRYADFDRDMFEDTLALAEKVAVNNIYPVNAEGDKVGAKLNPDTKEVTIPACYKPAYKAFCDAGFLSLSDDAEVGGMGMPAAVAIACNEYFSAASIAFSMYPGLTHGAAHLVHLFGSDELKSVYLENMLSGKWGGTMCLTEPDAGTDVGALKAKAVKQADGTYLITGQKIFISSGDHDMCENIIHPVLARIEGDPAGTKGISIFIVPKVLVNKDGSLGKKNDMVCSGIEHKMGIKGSATCTLSFGDNGKCVGWLLGEERKGMKIMFTMMNEARLGVGLQGLSVSSSAYMHAVTYARNRYQGPHVMKMLEADPPKVTIIEHPDVKRMLLKMKSYVEGMRMLSYYLAHNLDIERTLEGDASKEAQGLAEILIPICKAGNTDTAWSITAEAIQVYGGYGYCSDYPVEQLARDSKIMSLYEGTNGIQSLDLTMRKILMNPENYNYNVWKKRVADTIAKAKGIVDEKYITPVKEGMDRLDQVINMLKEQIAGGKYLLLFMNAVPLREAMFMMSLAWMHLWSLTVSQPQMKKVVGDVKGADREKLVNENLEAAYYSGKVLSAQYYIGVEFPKYNGMIESLLKGEGATIKASSATFTGALME